MGLVTCGRLLNAPVVWMRHNMLPICRKRNGCEPSPVALEVFQQQATLSVPNANRPVQGSGNDVGAVAGERDRCDRIGVVLEFCERLAILSVPNANRPVLR